MTDFKAKMHQIRFHGALPQTPLGGAYSARGRERGWLVKRRERGKGREGKRRGGKGRAPSYC